MLNSMGSHHPIARQNIMNVVHCTAEWFICRTTITKMMQNYPHFSVVCTASISIHVISSMTLLVMTQTLFCSESFLTHRTHMTSVKKMTRTEQLEATTIACCTKPTNVNHMVAHIFERSNWLRTCGTWSGGRFSVSRWLFTTHDDDDGLSRRSDGSLYCRCEWIIQSWTGTDGCRRHSPRRLG